MDHTKLICHQRNYQYFFSFITVLSWLGRQLVGDRSSIDRRPVASSRKEVPPRSPTSRRSVGNQSPISRRPVADESATNCKTYLRLLCDLCDLCDRFEFWSRRGRRAVAVYVWLRLKQHASYHTVIRTLIHLSIWPSILLTMCEVPFFRMIYIVSLNPI